MQTERQTMLTGINDTSPGRALTEMNQGTGAMNSSKIGELVLSTEEIKVGVTAVASALRSTFDGENLIAITMVPGGLFFSADLLRELPSNIKIDYISCPHTPGDRNNTSSIAFNQNIPLCDQHVVLVDDAIESGGTMKRVAEYIDNTYNPKSLSIATLFVKPGRVDIPYKQFFAYEMEDDGLLVGYGLPWRDEFRNIPYISRLKQ